MISHASVKSSRQISSGDAFSPMKSFTKYLLSFCFSSFPTFSKSSMTFPASFSASGRSGRLAIGAALGFATINTFRDAPGETTLSRNRVCWSWRTMPARTAGGFELRRIANHGRLSSSNSQGKLALRSSRMRRRGRSSVLWSFNVSGQSSSKRVRPGDSTNCRFNGFRRSANERCDEIEIGGDCAGLGASEAAADREGQAALVRFARHGDLDRLPPAHDLAPTGALLRPPGRLFDSGERS